MPTLHLFDPEARMDSWIQSLGGNLPVPCAVVHPCDEGSLRGALDSAARGLIAPILVGPIARLQALAGQLGLSLAGIPLMKGSLHTDELMGAVLKRSELRTGRRMSHVFRFEVPANAKPLLVTDAAINIAPNLVEKADIIRNAVDLAHALGIAEPKVALLSAVETVTDKLASPVAGQADILFVPDLKSGNMPAKQLEYLAGAASCGVVLGARVPIALTSRADPAISRVGSAALAGVLARANAAAKVKPAGH